MKALVKRDGGIVALILSGAPQHSQTVRAEKPSHLQLTLSGAPDGWQSGLLGEHRLKLPNGKIKEPEFRSWGERRRAYYIRLSSGTEIVVYDKPIRLGTHKERGSKPLTRKVCTTILSPGKSAVHQDDYVKIRPGHGRFNLPLIELNFETAAQLEPGQDLSPTVLEWAFDPWLSHADYPVDADGHNCITNFRDPHDPDVPGVVIPAVRPDAADWRNLEFLTPIAAMQAIGSDLWLHYVLRLVGHPAPDFEEMETDQRASSSGSRREYERPRGGVYSHPERMGDCYEGSYARRTLVGFWWLFEVQRGSQTFWIVDSFRHRTALRVFFSRDIALQYARGINRKGIDNERFRRRIVHRAGWQEDLSAVLSELFSEA
ncbi:MAG: hypothetical protein H6619_03200 [Deltaproteobacteria bacterium]|nr:hypothetical protein [Deltaproteobacteria bacterium]